MTQAPTPQQKQPLTEAIKTAPSTAADPIVVGPKQSETANDAKNKNASATNPAPNAFAKKA